MLYSHTFSSVSLEDGTPQGGPRHVLQPAVDHLPRSRVEADVCNAAGRWIHGRGPGVPPASAPPALQFRPSLLGSLTSTSAPALAIDSDLFSNAKVPRVLVEPDGSCEFLWMEGGTLAVVVSTSSRRIRPFFDTVQADSLGFEAATDRHIDTFAVAGAAADFSCGDLAHGLGGWMTGVIRLLQCRRAMVSIMLVTASALAANPERLGGGLTGNGTGNSNDHLDVFARRFRSTTIPGGRQLCLGSNGRFAREAGWQTLDGQQGPATPRPFRRHPGFWFFSASNVELLAEVLDGRAINGNFWVFWGGMTDLDVTLRVTDSLLGATRTYTNPAGSFPSMADVSAFPDPSPTSAPPARRQPEPRRTRR